MSNMYTDYDNKIAIQVPERFIDVKTGESYTMSAKIIEQLEFHANNNTMHHLIFSALQQYLNPKPVLKGGTSEILHELAEIKIMLEKGHLQMNPINTRVSASAGSTILDMKEVEEVLEAYGG